MKNLLKVSTFLMLGTLLTGCGGNAGAGKSYTYDSISTTFTKGTEAEFFSPAYNPSYKSKAEYEEGIKNRLLSPTKNGKINIGSVAPSNKTLYNNKEIKVYEVNVLEKDEYTMEKLCNYGADPDNKDIYHFYDYGTLGPDSTYILNLFNVHKQEKYGYETRGIEPVSYSYLLLTQDTGITINGGVMTVNLNSTLKCTENNQLVCEYTCTTVVVFKA